MSDMITCPICKGSGKSWRTEGIKLVSGFCLNCQGTGQVPAPKSPCSRCRQEHDDRITCDDGGSRKVNPAMEKPYIPAEFRAPKSETSRIVDTSPGKITVSAGTFKKGQEVRITGTITSSDKPTLDADTNVVIKPTDSSKHQHRPKYLPRELQVPNMSDKKGYVFIALCECGEEFMVTVPPFSTQPADSSKAKCPECKGTGEYNHPTLRDPNGRHICTFCNGTGELLTPIQPQADELDEILGKLFWIDEDGDYRSGTWDDEKIGFNVKSDIMALIAQARQQAKVEALEMIKRKDNEFYIPLPNGTASSIKTMAVKSNYIDAAIATIKENMQ